MARIIVIDDDRNVLESLASYLGRMGHEVVEASHGKEAMRALEESEVDLVITDINMPEMDGIEVINELRRSGIDVPVVALSGGGRLWDKEFLLANAKMLGAVSTIAKPFELNDISEAVEAALAGRS